MAASTGRRLQDGMIALFGLSIVTTGMAAIDETARQHIVNALHGEFPAIPPAFHPQVIGKHLAEILPVGDSSFIAIGVAGFVLVVFMFRM